MDPNDVFDASVRMHLGASRDGALLSVALPPGASSALRVRRTAFMEGAPRLILDRRESPISLRRIFIHEGFMGTGGDALPTGLVDALVVSAAASLGLDNAAVQPVLTGPAGKLGALGAVMRRLAEAEAAMGVRSTALEERVVLRGTLLHDGRSIRSLTALLWGAATPGANRTLLLLTPSTLGAGTLRTTASNLSERFFAGLDAMGVAMPSDQLVCAALGTDQNEGEEAERLMARSLETGWGLLVDQLLEEAALRRGHRIKVEVLHADTPGEWTAAARRAADWVVEAAAFGRELAPEDFAAGLCASLASGGPTAFAPSETDVRLGGTTLLDKGSPAAFPSFASAFGTFLEGGVVLSVDLRRGPFSMMHRV